MANTLRIRTGTSAPSAGSFAVSEPAWDATNSRLYVKNTAGSMVQIGGTVGAGATGLRNITTSTSDPSGGSDGDIWIKYTA